MYIFFNHLMDQGHINLRKLASALAFLAFQACEIVKELGLSQTLKKFEKGVNDPVTEADFKIQTLIIGGIRKIYPHLRVVGEETTEFLGKIDVDYEQIPQDIIPKDFMLSENVPTEELCVWIDPIDNTKGFIKGQFDEVTVLIGVSRNLKAQFGIIGLPYVKKCQNEKPVFDPQILMGSIEAKQALSSKKLGQWHKMSKPVLKNPIKIDVSSTRENPESNQFIDSIQAVKCPVGGSGKKSARVIKGQSDFMLYYHANNSKWDTCAGDAIIKALGGFFYSSHGEELLYDYKKSETKYVNDDGNVCGYSEEILKSWMDYLKVFEKKGSI